MAASTRTRPSASPRVRLNGRSGEYVLADADQTATGAQIVVTQDDVRDIQLAKGALYAGCKLLMQRRASSRSTGSCWPARLAATSTRCTPWSWA